MAFSKPTLARRPAQKDPSLLSPPLFLLNSGLVEHAHGPLLRYQRLDRLSCLFQLVYRTGRSPPERFDNVACHTVTLCGNTHGGVPCGQA